MLRSRALFIPAFSLLCLAACGSSTPKAEAPEPAATGEEPPAVESAAEPEEAAEAQKLTLPTECAGSGEICTPPKAFVDRLCQDVYPGIALLFFRQGTPWTRAYLTRKTEAWNAAGGASIQGFLEFDEEVIVLKHRAVPKGGMQVSGAGGGYEAFRLNGSCVTLSGEEVTLKRPPQPKYPKLEWRYLESEQRDAMKEDEKIDAMDSKRRKECKGVTMGDVSAECEKADKALSDLVAQYVVNGGELPAPKKMPE